MIPHFQYVKTQHRVKLKIEMTSNWMVSWGFCGVLTCLAPHQSSCLNQLRRCPSCLQDVLQGSRCWMAKLPVQTSDGNPSSCWQCSSMRSPLDLIQRTSRDCKLIQNELLILCWSQRLVRIIQHLVVRSRHLIHCFTNKTCLCVPI